MGYAFDVGFQGRKNLADGSSFYKMQVIKCRLGSPQEVIATFDIRNCMIGFNKTHTWEEITRRPFEKLNLLDIASFNNPHLISRVSKYICNHKYEGFSEQCHKPFIDWMWAEYHKLPELNTQDEDHEKSRARIRGHLTPLIRQGVFTDADLLLFMALYAKKGGRADYNPARDALSRSDEPPQIHKATLQADYDDLVDAI
jgi:hypothetical protein